MCASSKQKREQAINRPKLSILMKRIKETLTIEQLYERMLQEAAEIEQSIADIITAKGNSKICLVVTSLIALAETSLLQYAV